MKKTITLLLLLASIGAQATVWRVNNNPTMIQNCLHCFDDLQDAINSSQVAPGDTIHLEASVLNYGDITVNKPLTIIGPGFFLGDNPGEQNNLQEAGVERITFTDGSSGSSIYSIRLGYGLQGPVLLGTNGNDNYSLNNITISRCRINGHVRYHFNANNSSYGEAIVINGNYIDGDVIGLHVQSSITNLVLTNNYISGHLELNEYTSGVILNNVIEGEIEVYSGISDFYNNICTANPLAFNENDNGQANVHDNIFVDRPSWVNTNSNYQEAIGDIFPTAGSNLEDNLIPVGWCTNCDLGFAISGTTQMGIYGGDNPYRRAGIPNIPSIYELNTTTSANPGGTVEVQVSTKSN